MNPSPSPQISVLLPIYNGAATLERALNSVLEQTFVDYEIICIDDASTDATALVLKKWQHKSKPGQLNVVTNTSNVGLTGALNVGLQKVRGQYIARLDSDDYWQASKLAEQWQFMLNHPEVGVLGCWYNNVRQAQTTLVRTPITDHDIRRDIWRRNPFGHSCVLMLTQLLRDVDGYNERLAVGQDLDLWFRLLPRTTFANLPQVLCVREVTPAPRKTRAQMRQTVRTVHRYIKLYRQPFYRYFNLAEAVAVLYTPLFIKKILGRL